MYFECNHGVVAEDGTVVKSRYIKLGPVKGINPSAGPPANDKDLDGTSVLRIWGNVLWAYGCRNLSKPTDKLPASKSTKTFAFLSVQIETITKRFSAAKATLGHVR